MESLESSLLEGFELHSGGSTPAYSYDTTVTVQYRDGVCATSNMDYFDFDAKHVGSKHDIIGYRVDEQTEKKNVDAQTTSTCNCKAIHDEPHWPSCHIAWTSCTCDADLTGQHANACPMTVFNTTNKKDGFTYSFGNSLIPIVVGFDAFKRIEQAKPAVKDYLANLGQATAQPTQYMKEQQAMSSTDDYKSLSDVLERAYQQAAHGKGRERHAQDQPFNEQPMQTISQLVGSSDGLRYQAIKKIQEAGRMDKDAAVRELLGAINYLAGTIIYMESDK